MSASDIIASIALVVSILSFVATEIRARKSDKEQSNIKEEQNKIRKLLLNKEEKLAINERKAVFRVCLTLKSKNAYYLDISNIGNAMAKNIELCFPDNDGKDYLHMEDVENKFPLERLQPEQKIMIIAGLTDECKTKYRIKLIWDDDYQEKNEEEFWIFFA